MNMDVLVEYQWEKRQSEGNQYHKGKISETLEIGQCFHNRFYSLLGSDSFQDFRLNVVWDVVVAYARTLIKM
jgi:hypothetical protein